MAITPDEFSYDGTFEGLLCVVLKCMSLRVTPRKITPDYLIDGDSVGERFMRIRTDYNLADKLYRMLGKYSGPENQQMAMDYFLTAVPDKERDIYVFICLSLKYGSYIAGDYKDESLRRIHMAIRDLYREVQSYIGKISFKDVEGVSVGFIKPRNCILPILSYDAVRVFDDRKVMVYDTRHYLLLYRLDSAHGVIDVRGRYGDITDAIALKERLWPAISDRISQQERRHSEGLNRYLSGFHQTFENADSLTSLWNNAV